MNCPNCSNLNVEGAQFCGSCGFALTQPAVQDPMAAQTSTPASPAAPPTAIPVQDAGAAAPAAAGTPVAPPPEAQPSGAPYHPTSPASQAPNLLQQDYAIKLFKPLHLFIIVLVNVAYAGLQNLAPIVITAVWVASIIFTVITVSKIKKNPASGTTQPEKQKAVALMAFDPLITQAIYYYRLRNVNPQMASGFNMLGWKVFGLGIALFVAAVFFFSLLLANKSIENNAVINPAPQSATTKVAAYPERTKTGFLKGCTDESGNAQVCTCLFNEIEKNITHEEFIQAEDQIRKTGSAPAKYQAAQDDALKACGAIPR